MSVVMDCVVPVPTFFTCTVAPAMAEPEGSLTVPCMDAVGPCAQTKVVARMIAIALLERTNIFWVVLFTIFAPS